MPTTGGWQLSISRSSGEAMAWSSIMGENVPLFIHSTTNTSTKSRRLTTPHWVMVMVPSVKLA